MVHFIEMDLDHYGRLEKIHQADMSLDEFEEGVMIDYGNNVYKIINLSDSEKIFLCGGNMRIYAWESGKDMDKIKYYEHPKRYKDAMTKEEFESLKSVKAPIIYEVTDGNLKIL